jgi:hypothetical protein
MEELKQHHNRCTKKYTVQDEKGKDIHIEQVEYENPNEYMPLIYNVIKVFEERMIILQNKNDELQKEIMRLQQNINLNEVQRFIPPPPPPEIITHSTIETTSSRSKKPINMKF